MSASVREKLAFCSWSVQPSDPSNLIYIAAKTGLSRVQLHLDPLYEQPGWSGAKEAFERAGLEVVSGMYSPLGEDYKTPESIRKTGGVVADGLWPQNRERFLQAAQVAADLGLQRVSMHAGFLPAEQTGEFGKLVSRIADLASILHEAAGATLLLETGQETADELLAFLRALSDGEVGVNFDPANMLLYDKGDPIAALRKLAPHVKQVHVKDALRPNCAGAWGTETPFGEGAVDWTAFFAELAAIGYGGDWVIERESGNQRVKDICTAAEGVAECSSIKQ